ncbi:hypothetical protein [Brevundimonas sp.]|uniref:DUF6874 family protein n=1 Tax=Brevundimonas sp. TaxID=1871086 RepID=UPI00260C29E3|nr:hypothetical protein [Brevundimonas sp.]
MTDTPATHASDCATHNMPAEAAGPCDCKFAGPFVVDFETTSTDATLIDSIVDRYLALIGKMGPSELRLELRMDLTAWHLNGAPLDLEKLEAATDFTLAHDVQGINHHIERDGRDPTLAYQAGIFVPKCDLRQAEETEA